MINEGNSLAELQAKVLRASPHERKSETSLQGPLVLSLINMMKKHTQAGSLFYPIPVYQNSFIAQLMKTPLPRSSELKVDLRGIYAATSRLAGKRASVIFIDDSHIT